MSLTLERLPVYYQLLISEIQDDNQIKINSKINEYKIESEEFISDQQSLTKEFRILKCTHSGKVGVFTPISALALSLLELRSIDDSIKVGDDMVSYLTFKLALQTGLSSEWQRIKSIRHEKDYFSYLTAESALYGENYQESINVIESLMMKLKSEEDSILSDKMFYFDCYDLLILAKILDNQHDKAIFDINQYFYMYREIGSKKLDETFSKVFYWNAKHKQLLLSRITNQKMKENQIIREFSYDKKNIKDYFALGLVTGIVGLAYLRDSKFDESEKYLLESMHSLNQFGSLKLPNNTFMHLISLYIQQGNLNGAIRVFERHDKAFESVKHSTDFTDYKILLSQIYVILGFLEKSKNHFDWIIDNSSLALNINNPNMLLVLSSLALTHNYEEFANVCYDKLKSGLDDSDKKISDTNLEIFNSRMDTLFDGHKGNYFEVYKKLLNSKEQAIENQELDQMIDLNIDIVITMLLLFDITKKENFNEKIVESLKDIRTYVNSLELKEPKVQLLKGLAYYNFALDNIEEGLSYLREGFDLLDKEENPFLKFQRNIIARLSTNVQQYRNNRLMILISELNQFDIASSTISSGLFQPKSVSVTRDIWRRYCLQEVISSLRTISLQRIDYLVDRSFSLSHLPGVLKVFQ
jgi:hypothetical protein